MSTSSTYTLPMFSLGSFGIVYHCPLFCTYNLLLRRGDLVPNYSVNTPLFLLVSLLPLFKNLSSRNQSSASFDEVFNAAGQQNEWSDRPRPVPSPTPSLPCSFSSSHPFAAKREVLQILVRGICGYPPVVSQYQPRNGKGLRRGRHEVSGGKGERGWKMGYGRS